MSDYDRITYCDVVEACETCPRYGDDCDGVKRLDSDFIRRREERMQALCKRASEMDEEQTEVGVYCD